MIGIARSALIAKPFSGFVLRDDQDIFYKLRQCLLETETPHAGELAASMAHELSQPLTAILSNAQAALRFIQKNPPEIDEVRAIIQDIIYEG